MATSSSSTSTAVTPAQTLELRFHSLSISLEVDMSVGIGGERWPAASNFCNLISNPLWAHFFGKLFQDKRIVDLGSGTGITGIVIDKLYNPQEIIITDQESHVPLIERNLSLNAVDRSRAEVLDWLDCQNATPYDIILAFECVYREDLYQPLIDTMLACSDENTVIILGITREFSKVPFYDALKKHFSFTLIPYETLQIEGGNPRSKLDPGSVDSNTNGKEHLDTLSPEVGLFIAKRLRPGN
jgi:hypothetical protein